MRNCPNYYSSLDKSSPRDYLCFRVSKQIQISGKNLGELVLKEFCPRCFWLKLRLRKLPFQIFPGVLSSIDSYTKRIVQAYVAGDSNYPVWLKEWGKLVHCEKKLSHQTFMVLDSATNVLITGVPDALFVKPDGSLLIVDYKTARYTESQEEIIPMYEIQLNAYARIAEGRSLGKVTDLALIYMEPVTDAAALANPKNHREDGFAMGFAAKVRRVELNLDSIPPLLKQVRKIHGLSKAPPGREGCKDCQILEKIAELIA